MVHPPIAQIVSFPHYPAGDLSKLLVGCNLDVRLASVQGNRARFWGRP